MKPAKRLKEERKLFNRLRAADEVTRRVLLIDIRQSFGAGFAEQLRRQVEADDLTEAARPRKARDCL